MIIFTLYLLQATYKGKDSGPGFNFLVCILTRSIILNLSFLFGNLVILIETLPILCSINWGEKVSNAVWIFDIIGLTTYKLSFVLITKEITKLSFVLITKEKQNPKSQCLEKFKFILLSCFRSGLFVIPVRPCEPVSPCSTLTGASTTTRWGERCWQTVT